VLSFETVKRDSALRPRITAWMQQTAATVEMGLRAEIDDGAVRAGIGVSAAVTDVIGSGVGLPDGWFVLPAHFDLPAELGPIRARFLRDYGA